MPWVETGDFERLVESELKADLDRCEQIRGAAVKRFWLTLGIGLAVAVAALALLWGSVGPGPALVAATVCLVITLIAALNPLEKGRSAIKQPIAEALARRHGLTWSAKPADPPGFVEAARLLFGHWTTRRLNDLWSGEIDGRPFAVYEAYLSQKSGKSSVTLFQGHLWRLQAGTPRRGTTVVVPDKGAFNFFKPRGDMKRISFDDAAFERVFETYSTDRAEAEAALTAEVRAELTSIRQDAGKTWLYLGGDHVVAGISGGDRFEPGSMFKATPGVDRARTMWNELDGAVGFAGRLSAAFPAR